VNDISVSLSIPLDSDDFLRRECPHCELEFKVYVGEDAEDGGDEDVPPEGYCCPYCGRRAAAEAWNTKEQAAAGEAALSVEVEKMIERELGDSVRGLERASGGLIKASVSTSGPTPRPRELEERDDMVRVDFGCHPETPLKIVEDWINEVHCFVCGTTQPAPDAPIASG
jgi:hypothetical protein